MDFLVLFAIVAAPIVGVIWYYRAYKEARIWREVHAAWGLEQQRHAVAIYNELTRQGIRAQLTTSGTFEKMMRPITRPHASIRVRREEFDFAARIVHSLTRG
ncbi:MAG: hypothetical protein OXL97_06445 [Chloroflexota bacterium]|nr:hypothetical protein [Chloroflexota bacterium]MDE2884898.1 hypothetical protein [Chloroflexota bacterium]